ncbi:MAG TPA: ABC transporter substrate-binding protein [Chloroflexota bacterium]|nr:ABC transporter substrate-binding protein [Chloroflexota bacterium]
MTRSRKAIIAVRPALALLTLTLLVACGASAPSPAAPSPAPASATPPPSASAAHGPAAPVVARGPAPPADVPAPADAAAPLAPPVAVRIGVLSSLSDAGIYVAAARGYFRDEGLDASLEPFGATPEMTAPLAAGQLDVGAGAPTPSLFNAISRDIPVKLVADKGLNSRGHGFNALVVRKDLIDSGRVQTLADLRGLKVASPSANSPMELQIESGLRAFGLDLSALDVVNMPFPDMITALANGSVDAAALIEPFVTTAVSRSVGVRFKGADELYPDQQIAGILYAPSFYQHQPEAARRWMVAYLRGVRDVVAAFDHGRDKAAIVQILSERTTVKDPALYDRMVPPGLDPDGYLNLASIAADQDWYERHGLVAERQPLADFVDYQYLDYAHQRLGRVGPAPDRTLLRAP